MKSKKTESAVSTIAEIQSRMIVIRGELSLLDRDVAALYGVETKRVLEAVRNNQEKFPAGYVVSLEPNEVELLRSKISSLESQPGKGHHSKHGYKVFTERGLYMLATILKGERAVRTTIDIIETYAKVRSLKRELVELHQETDIKMRGKKLHHFGETLADIVMPDLETVETESTLELNFLVGKLKHTVRRIKKSESGNRGCKDGYRGKSAD